MDALSQAGPARNIRLYPWFRFFQNLLFWQAIWFLYFQKELSAAEAILLYIAYDISTTVLEVPSGYMSDRLGRRITLIVSSLSGLAGTALLALGDSFAAFATGQVLLGAGMAFASGTDTALLYESLNADGRRDEIERQEVRAWRFAFAGLAVSAASGGAMALYADRLPFFAGAVAFTGAAAVALCFGEPRRTAPPDPNVSGISRFAALRAALSNPTLAWLFCLSVLMYGFSHLPFIFGQPFIQEALTSTGLSAEAPLVSGAVTTCMMILSLAASLIAPGLRRWAGLSGLLLLAFAMQIALSGVLALTDSAVAIAFLFLRMVPDSLSRPFILARIQPLLGDESRATYLSLQSLCARLVFAATLYLASLPASAVGQMAHSEIRVILGWYVAGGLIGLAALAVWSARLAIDTRRP